MSVLELRSDRTRFVRLTADFVRQRGQIERIADEARQALSDFAERIPRLVEQRGMASIVHDFYTAIEHLFEKIAPELNGGLPAGPFWQRELLENMTLDLPGLRPPVVTQETARELEELRRFRDRCRGLDSFELEWPRLRRFLRRVPATWSSVKMDLDGFESFLVAAADQ